MAWSEADQNPSLAPTYTVGAPGYGTNYAAGLSSMMGSGSTAAPAMSAAGQPNYAAQLNAAWARAPARTRTRWASPSSGTAADTWPRLWAGLG